MLSQIFIASALLITISLFLKHFINRRRHSKAQLSRFAVGTHVIISGGSKGIGKSLAKKFAALGTHITIIARNQTDLETAKTEIEAVKKRSMQIIRAVSLDLTTLSFPDPCTSASCQQLDVLRKILGDHDRCDILINCCGSSIPARFEDISQQQFHFMMDVNYFSAVNLTRVLLPTMKSRSLNSGPRSKAGRIVFVSSMCGLMSFFGYSAYSASKFAIVGLAQALQMELRPFNIGITVSFPPDTDTPGFEEENKIKPSLTAKISETGNVYGPDDVASSIISDIVDENFYSTVGLENLAVLSTANTFMPPSSYTRLAIECMLAGPLKLVGYIILRSWYKMVDEAAPNEIIRSKVALSCSETTDSSKRRERLKDL